MRIIERTSKWAKWARRCASFALPLSILPVLLHRNQMLSSEAFEILLGLAILLALLAVFCGIGAYIRLWQTGDRGWGKASFGIFVGLLCLSPIAYGVFAGAQYPLINDVSTSYARPLDLVVKPDDEISILSAQNRAKINLAFPGVQTRFYDLSPEKVFALVENMVTAREWDMRVRRAPVVNGRPGQINALAMTFMGWRDEVALRVERAGQATRVDMRSVSLNGIGDLGANGKRIEAFLSDLDALVSEQLAQAQ